MKTHALLLVALTSIFSALLQGQQVPVDGPQLDPVEADLWSIPFRTTPTHRYRLERSSDLISWQPVQTITASGSESRVTDRRTPHSRRFWRVVALGPSSGNPTVTDTIPPTVGTLQAAFGEFNGNRTLTLETTVTDNLGVEAVSIFDGMNLLGSANAVGGNRWQFVYTYTNASELNGRAFVARAEDAAGNTAFSAPLSLAFNNTDRFQPINGGDGDEVALGVDGNLPAFAFNPSSDSAAGESTGISFAFPEGGMITSDANGRTAVAFEAATFEFEAQAPLKLKEPLSVTSNQTKTLPLEAITFEDIAKAFEQDPDEGIEVELFGAFPLTWKGGTLEGAAIRAPQFAVNIPNFPLPAVSAEAPDLLVNFSQGEPVQLPFSGTFELPGAGENAPSLHAPASSPLWVTLCPDGRVSLRGRVEVRIPGSVRFVADIVLEDPYYRLRIATLESEAEARERLANNLLANPSEVITSGMSAAQLQESADVLRNHADAYANFAANTIASAAAGSSGLDNLTSSSLLNQISSPTTALLDAWSLVDGSHLEALGSYFDQVGKSAASSQSLEGALDSARALVRIQNGDLTGSSEALDAAVELALLAITNRAQDTTADVGLESFLRISEAMSDLQVLGESDVLSIIQSSINALVQQIAVRESARLDLSTLPSGPLVDLARTFGTIHANLDAAGFDVSPLDPLLDDLFEQTMAALEDQQNEAELGNDLFGLVETTLTWIRLSEFSDIFTTPAATTINQLTSEFALPEDGIALNDLIEQASAWQEISDKLALNANVSSELAAALNSAIENALPEVSDLQNPDAIEQLIQAGTTMQALAPAVSQAWFDTQLPAMIGRLRDIATVNKQSSTLDAIVENLLDAADARPDFAEAYLTQAGDLLESAREVALDLWREEESRRATASDYPTADIQLPGDITIDDAYGEISFHRVTQELSGAFGGSIKLPNFGDSFLTVANASLNSSGAFDINAYGSMSFPFDSPVATVSIREDHPMHVRYAPDEGLRLSAGTRLAFENGMAFEGDLTLEDPIYIFRIAATGLRFDLLNLLTSAPPTFPARDNVDDEALERMVDFYGALGDQMSLTEPEIGNLELDGNPPEFAGEADSEPTDLIELYHNYLYIESLSANPNLDNIAAVLDKTMTLLDTMTSQLEKEFNEFTEVEDEVLVEAADTEARHLMIDFGEGDQLYDGTGPAFEEGFTLEDATLWNAVTQHNNGGLHYSDGTLASGVRLDVGSKFVGLAEVLWDFPPSPERLSGRMGLGPVALNLLGDNLSSDSLIPRPSHRVTVTENGEERQADSDLFVRIGGLGPGLFRVYALADSLTLFGQDTSRENVIALGVVNPDGSLAGSKNFLLTTGDGDSPLESFAEGGVDRAGNYVVDFVAVEEGKDLLIASKTLPSSRGLLAGLEIVEVLPEISQFSATPSTIDLGGSSLLAWSTKFATKVEINRGIGTVAPNGSRRVAPQVSKRYTMTASNLSGSVTESVLVIVDGPKRRYQKLLTGLEKVSRVEKELAATLNDLAQAFRDENDERANEAQDKLDDLLKKGSRILISDEVLNNTAAIKDRDTMAKAASAALNFTAATQALGREDEIGVLGQTQDLVARSHTATIGKWLNPNGSINTAKIGTLSSEESQKAAKELLDSAVDSTMVGNQNPAIRSDIVTAMINNSAVKTMEEFGINPATGVADLSNKSFEETRDFLRKMLNFRSSFMTFENGENDLTEEAAEKMIATVKAELPKVSEQNWKRRAELLNAWRSAQFLGLKLGPTPEYLAELETMTAEMNRQAGRSKRLTRVELAAMQLVATRLVDANTTQAWFEERTLKALRGVRARVDGEWSANQIPEATKVARELRVLYGFWQLLRANGVGASITGNLRPPVQVTDLNTKIKELIPGLGGKQQRALTRYQKELKVMTDALRNDAGIDVNAEGLEVGEDNHEDEFRAALLDALYENTEAQAIQADSFASRLGALDPSELLLGLGLPGELRVDDVFGQIFYNRDTGFLEGSFGGRLTIPETQAFFEISEATIANDGSFTFKAASAGPLPFGGIRVTAAIDAMNTLEDGFSITGNGSMTIPGENGSPDQTFAVEVGYSQANARMFFNGAADGAPLRFTDNFVVVGAATSLEVSTLEPFGKLVLNGDAGIFARGNLPAVPTRTDFFMYLDGAVFRFENDANGFDLALEEGNIRLPEDVFTESLCPDNDTLTAVSGPAITLTESQPLLLRYDEDPGTARFTGNLAIQDVGITIPDVDDFRVDVCSGNLVFDGDSLPAILNVNARGVLPLPGSTAEFRVIDAMWTLDGIPQGIIQLENDASLFDANGFQVVLLGEGKNGCPDGVASITTNAANVPTFELTGGIGLILPTDVISGVDGEVMELSGCGGFSYTQGQPPTLTVDQLAVSGDVSLGGPDGLRARNIDLVARNVSSLFNSGAELPFLLEINSGQLDFPNGVTFALQQGFISQDGSFDLGARASGIEFAGAQIQGDVSVFRSAAGLIDAGGGVDVTLTESGRTFSASVNYESATQTLDFLATTTNLDLQLADDFVIFDAGIGFSVSGAQQAGYLSLDGSFGIIAKGTAVGDNVSPDDYELVLDNAVVTLFYDQEGFGVALDDGTLRLPAFFEETICPGNEGLPSELSGPIIGLNPDNPIQLRFTTATNTFDYSGEVYFRNIGFEVPGVDGLRLAVCDASLVFNNGLPRLANLNASMEIPLPNESAFVDVQDAEWGLNGFPTGTIALREDLALLEQGGFTLSLLGQSEGLCEAGTALTISENAGQPVFRLDGGIELSLPAETLMEDAGGTVSALACGGVEIGFQQLPILDIEALGIGGDSSKFRLGGANGLLVEGATIFAFDIQNLFNQSPETPFILSLSGRFQVPDGPGFGLRDAEFIFDGSPLPKFAIGGADLILGENFEVIEGLPIQISEASFDFVEKNLPLPNLLFPENIQIGVSAGIAIPPDAPIVSGRVNDLNIRLVNGVPQVEIDGFGFGIEGFEVPPLSLTGQMYVGGLSGPPENIFFAGEAGGKLNGAGVKALVAFNLRGPIGICFDVSAGPAGIPLGPTGFLLTGVSGGVSFANSNADPCDFAALIQLDEDGRPMEIAADTEAGGEVAVLREASSWDVFRKTQERLLMYQEISEHPEAILFSLNDEEDGGPEFPCPTGVCPPRTMNILCQPHPDRELYPERIIVKFTSLDQAFMDSLTFTPSGQNQEVTIREYLEANQLTTATEIGNTVATAIREVIDEITPRLDDTFVPNADALNAVIEDTLDTVEQTFASVIASGVQEVLGNNDSVYGAILEAAYAGVPCFDATVKVTGTLSHASVSSFLSGTVGAILSTAGSAGVVGSVNLVGIPVGRLAAFIAATDEFGDPNPSMCGTVNVAVGPLELGALKALYECDGCVTGMFAAFIEFGECVGDDVMDELLAKVAPELAGLGVAGLDLLSDSEKAGLLAEVFSNPPNVPGLTECFVAFLQTSVGAFNPELTLCGAVQPKIFGLGLGPSLVEVQAAADKEGFAANFGFSPSYLMSTFIPIFPSVAVDTASFGFGVGVPSPDDILAAGIEGRLSNPQALAQFAAEGLDHVLANSTYTIGYEFQPFGFKGLNAEARALMPNLTDHPAHPLSTWERPEDLGLPSRKDVLLGALEANLLANPLWTGNGDEASGTALSLAFPEGSPERNALQGLSFQDDYFPHGGLVGAARLSMPKAVVDAPPATLFTLLDTTLPPLERLTAGLDFVSNHLLQSTEVGSMAFYTPAPNPPIFTNPDTGTSLSPGELLEAIMSFDGSTVAAGGLYPIEETFLSGYLEGRLLGVPIADAEVTAIAPDPAEGTPGCFEIRASVPENSWMKGFVDSANLDFVVKQAPPRPIEERFLELQIALSDLIANNASPAAMQQFLAEIQSSLDSEMPKASLEASVNNLRIPDGLDDLITLDGSTSATLVAYSPCFDPSAPGDNPLALAKRRGGIAMQARLRFLDLVTINNAELGITPGEGLLPALSGLLDAPLVSAGGLTFREVEMAFNSQPNINQPYLSFDGTLDPVTLGPFVSLQPLDAAGELRGSFQAVRTNAASPAVSVMLEPAKITTPILGDDLALVVHGSSINEAFSFSTETPWNASLTLQGQLKLRDNNGETLVAIGAVGQNLSGSVGGTGLEDVVMEITIPSGVQLTTLPNQPHAQTLTISSTGGASSTLRIESNGRVYFDSGMHEDIGLPGVIMASGRLEFGYEPDDRVAGFRPNVASINFGSSNLATPITRTVTISNPGETQLTVFANTEGDADFRVMPNTLAVAPGESAALSVRFLPTTAGTHRGTLRLQHNGPASPTLIPLAGTGTAVAIYYQSTDRIAFGEHPVGGGANRFVTVANLGQAPLNVSNIQIPDGSPFAVSPSTLALDPGEEKQLFVTYRPTTTGATKVDLTLVPDNRLGEQSITLTGTAAEQRWHVERQCGSTLQDVAMMNSSTGVAVGQNGELYRYVPLTFGSWSPLEITNINLRAAAARSSSVWVAGQSGTVLRSTDFNLATWTPITDPDVVGNGGNVWNAIGIDQFGFITLAGDNGRIVKQFSEAVYNDVSPDEPDNLLGIAYNGTVAVAVGQFGTIRRSTNSGATWSNLPSVSGINVSGTHLNGIAFGSGNVGIIVGQFGTILRSTNNGVTWSNVNHEATSATLTDVVANGSNVYAVGLNQTFLRSSNNGATWTAEGTAGGNVTYNGVAEASGAIWAVGQGGRIDHRPTTPLRRGKLVYEPGILDFGTVPIGQTSFQTFKLRNIGTGPVSITEITPFTNEITILDQNFEIPPGGSRVLRFYVRPTQVRENVNANMANGNIQLGRGDQASDSFILTRLRSTNNSWQAVASPLGDQIRLMQFTDAQTGYVATEDELFKTDDGGSSWERLAPGAPGPIKALNARSSSTLFIGGGDTGSPFIRRSTNGGNSWSNTSLPNDLRNPVSDISFYTGSGGSFGYALGRRITSNPTANGVVLQTRNSGSSWQVTRESPSSFFIGSALHTWREDEVYAASGGTLYRTTSGGSLSWNQILAFGGAFPITDVFMVGEQHGWLGGNNGLFRRSTNAGQLSPTWQGSALFTTETINSLHFTSQDEGWCATNRTLYRTTDGGQSWKEDLNIRGNNFLVVHGSGDGTYAAGTNGAIWKHAPSQTQRIPLGNTPVAVDFGDLLLGQEAQQVIEVKNIGTVPLHVLRASIDPDREALAFDVSTIKETLAPGERANVTVQFVATSVGEFENTLVIDTNGGPLTTTLTGRRETAPAILTLDTFPSGISITVAGKTVRTPAAFTIGEGGLTVGSEIAITAPSTATFRRIPYVFQQWGTGEDNALTLTVPNESERLVATYVEEVIPEGRDHEAGHVEDIPTGPWLRLTEASLEIPGLGGFGVEGSVFLSTTNIQASLAANAVRIPTNPSEFGLFEMTAGSWQFDWQRSSHFRMTAEGPGLALLEHPVAPPSSLTIAFFTNGNFLVSSGTSGTLPLVPGVAELGPGGFVLARTGNVFDLNVTGELRMFPTGNDEFAFRQSTSFQASVGPFTHTLTAANLPASLLQNDYLDIRRRSNSRVELSLGGDNAFALTARNFDVVLLNQNVGTVSTLSLIDDAFNFSTQPPAQPFQLGPFRLSASLGATIAWDVSDAAIQVDLPETTLSASGVSEWPSAGITFPAFSINTSGDFDKTIALPAFELAGVDLNSGQNANRYLRFYRQNGVLGLNVRDQQNFFLSQMNLGFDIDSTGTVGGFFRGTVEVDTPIYGQLEISDVALSYDGDRADYQFAGLVGFISQDFGVEFGSSGGRFRHVFCESDDEELDDCEPGLFVLP